MREKFKLRPIEKIEQDILRVILILDFTVIAKGIYNQSNNIDQDNILFPAFLILSILFCLIYTINSFTAGNLVKNWASTEIYTFIFNFIKNKKTITDENAQRLTTRIFGFFTLAIAVGMIVYIVLDR